MSSSGGAIVARRSECDSLSSPASLTKGVSSGCGLGTAGTRVAVARSVVGTSGIGGLWVGAGFEGGGGRGGRRAGGQGGRLLGDRVDEVGHREETDRDRLVVVVNDHEAMGPGGLHLPGGDR